MIRHGSGSGGGLTEPMMHHNSSSTSNPQQGSGTGNNPSNNTGNGPSVTRIFIQRDYRQGIDIRFTVDFPPELIGRIDQHAFEYTLNRINQLFDEAEEFNCSTCCESITGFLTANLIYLCKDTGYEKCLKKVSKFVVEQNQLVYLPRGLEIVDPIERGLRCIEIVIHNSNEQLRS